MIELLFETGGPDGQPLLERSAPPTGDGGTDQTETIQAIRELARQTRM